MKPYRYFTLLLGLLAALVLMPGHIHATHHAPRTTFTPTPCPFPVAQPERVECGTLIVPADHTQPDGPTVQLAVSILRSQSDDAAAEPVLYLAGGPGDAAAYLAGAAQLPLVAEGRWDFIFLDQRGTGFSQPNLTCPEIESQPDWPTLLTQGADIGAVLYDLNVQVAQQCHNFLVQQGIDLTLFTTTQNAQDIVALRQALEVEQWYLYGFSYGTYLAQEVLRYDAAAVRGVLLDSPVPQDKNLYANAPLLTAAAYDHLFTTCTDNLACRIAYPNLEAQFLALIEQLNEQPLTVTLAPSKQPVTIHITGDQLAAFLPTLMGTPHTFGLIPSLLNDLEKGETEGLAVLVSDTISDPVRPQHGLRYAIICQDLFHPLTVEERAAATVNIPTVYTRSFTQEIDAMTVLCAEWPKGDAAAPRPPLPTDIPTLILVGELDVGTPALWGEQLHEQFPQSTYALIPNVGHGVLQGGDCPNSMMLSFLLDPEGSPNTNCVRGMRSPTFLIDENVSRPWARAGIILLAGGLVIAMGRGGYTLFRSQPAGQVWRQFTWRASRRALGWWPTIISLFILALTFMNYDGNSPPLNEIDGAFHTATIVATLIPLMAGLQAALLFSPDDEPALEVQLAAPRPLIWTILERLVWVIFWQGGIGLVGMFIARSLTGTDETVGLSLVRWVAPMVALIGIGLFITLISRQPAFGIAMTGMLWFALLVFGQGLVLRWPFLWPIHLYLTPDTLSLTDYGLNRVSVTLIGLGFLFMALRQVRDEERVLLGTARRGKAKAGSVMIQDRGWSAAAIHPSPLYQFFAHVLIIIRNEFRLQWRRRATLVIVLSTTVFPIFTALIIRNGSNDMNQVLVDSGVFNPSEAQRRVILSIISFSFAPLYTVLLLLVPPVVADIIPKDRQLGVSELFASVPLSQPAYLLGKLLGMWLSLLYGMGLNLLITLIIWRIVLGAIAIGPMLEVWFFAAGSVLLLNGGLAVLLAAPFRQRRLAILIGVSVAMFALINLGTDLPHNLTFYLNISRPAILNYYAFGQLIEAGVIPFMEQTTLRDVWLTLLAGLGELIVVAVLVGTWLTKRSD